MEFKNTQVVSRFLTGHRFVLFSLPLNFAPELSNSSSFFYILILSDLIQIHRMYIYIHLCTNNSPIWIFTLIYPIAHKASPLGYLTDIAILLFPKLNFWTSRSHLLLSHKLSDFSWWKVCPFITLESFQMSLFYAHSISNPLGESVFFYFQNISELAHFPPQPLSSPCFKPPSSFTWLTATVSRIAYCSIIVPNTKTEYDFQNISEGFCNSSALSLPVALLLSK